MTTQKRAAIGGEIGANGEFYEGGKFIATKDNTKGTPVAKVRKLRKVQIAPYHWVMEISADATPIFQFVGSSLKVKEFDYASKVCILELSEGIRSRMYDRMKGFAEQEMSIEEIDAHWANMETLVERFNKGERWV